ncbi:HAD family hydrolase [Thermomicrobiaceae bacterium CFH 74404]|uniref:D,D-heptose 1,7-bisphosphate phosphatase n=1 Tax=Thermalbibacter longus TaxID=2951981 RepID=A0AA41W9Z5_9BACT|nr:HAD family hydrolase [Thermalbibacter longus]MCM8748091.1 HAD family hydrolase [Thermalbibacter longus]
MASRAIFLDRDGTLVWPRAYPSTPEELTLYEGIGPELHALQQQGFRLVVVTNQSGVAHGYFTVQALAQMHHHLARELSKFDVHLDGIYFCPHHPQGTVPEFRCQCACRKPEPGMLLAAAADLGLDLSRSWMVGDILDDIEAGKRAGCRTVLVDLSSEPAPGSPVRLPDFVVTSTLAGLQLIRAIEGCGPPIHDCYWPPRWCSAPEQERQSSPPASKPPLGRWPLAPTHRETACPPERSRSYGLNQLGHRGEEAR